MATDREPADGRARGDVARAREADSLAPAVTRAARILDAPGRERRRARRARASSPVASACRSRRSRTSAVPWPTPGWSAGSATGFALGRRLAELGGAYLASVDQVQEFYEAVAAPAGRLRGDRPARGPRRARDHLPRPPRWAPAGPADVGHRAPAAGVLDGDRQGGAGLAPRGGPGASPATGRRRCRA